MLASSFRQSTIDMPAGFVPTSATLTKWIQDTNAAAGGASPAISLWKADATEILVMRMPDMTFTCIFQHYRKCSWDRCLDQHQYVAHDSDDDNNDDNCNDDDDDDNNDDDDEHQYDDYDK